jgi:hypothetical protein
MDLIKDAIKTMLEREDAGDFTAAGLPDRRRLSKLVGLNVTAEDATIAWQALNNDAGKNLGRWSGGGCAITALRRSSTTTRLTQT